MKAFPYYLQKLEAAVAKGDATEHTHRPSLKTLIESLREGIVATNEPKRIECGAPDLIVTHGEIPIGYIETKDVGKSLDDAEDSEQLKRYRAGLSNLILTDYLEFRWYVRGEYRLSARLARLTKTTGKLKYLKDGAVSVERLLEAFLTADVPTVMNPRDLAVRMASITLLINESIRKALEKEDDAGPLHDQIKSFHDVLLSSLTADQFADMYAQTICYGLFAARYNAHGGSHFTRKSAAYELPKTNPFLRKLFSSVAGPDLDDQPHAWAVDDLAELLHRTDIAAVLEGFGQRTRREDPVVHFYETFLGAYNPELREKRGVYYTPRPVVSYIVRSVDQLLKTDFHLANGLADDSRVKITTREGSRELDTHKVLILDPAVGTGTFLYEVIAHIFDTFQRNLGMWSTYVSDHLLPRIFGFELLMAPYAVAHMKLGMQLAETGYDFKANERLRIYLTNALEEAFQVHREGGFTRWLIEEASAANDVKQDFPVMVVLGNPPYAGHSANKGQWIASLLHGIDTRITARELGTITECANYFEVDGQPLGEKNPKWLNDDYVKFIRFAQWRIEQTGFGILAFVTNHGYLDNQTFRGMRQSLMQTFDDIYVLDLHGNSNKKERCPDGSKDQNVFDIQQGVAIGIFVKRRNGRKPPATVRHADLWGLREVYQTDETEGRKLSGGKYYWLWQNELSTTSWSRIEPQPPSYSFRPHDDQLRIEFELASALDQIMPLSSVGVVTGRDSFALAYDQQPLRERMEELIDASIPDEQIRERYLSDSDKLDLNRARRLLRQDKSPERTLVRCLYRPFDERYLFYHDAVLERSRREVMQHMVRGNNLGFITTKQTRDDWSVHATRSIIGHKSLAAYDINTLFPLYVYASKERTQLFEEEGVVGELGRRANLTPDFILELSAKLGLDFIPDGKGDLHTTLGPEDFFTYCYGVFHSPTYRARYAEFLKSNFPRVPLTSNLELFRAMSRLGEELLGLHLMERTEPIVTHYPVVGENEVEVVRYGGPGTGGKVEGCVWINKHQYFEGVAPSVWGFYIGGYRVCQKWLKDRKGRKLTYDDLTHYQRLIAALVRTAALMEEIDETINEAGGWPLE